MAVTERKNPAMDARGLARVKDLFIGRFEVCTLEDVHERFTEQDCILTYNPSVPPKRFDSDVLHVATVNEDAAALNVIESE